MGLIGLGSVRDQLNRRILKQDGRGDYTLDADAVLQWHHQRGTAEHFNGELKIGFGMEQMPCGQTDANAVFFRIGVIAYNLFIGLKHLPPFQPFKHHTIATFRWKFFQMAGRIVHRARAVILKWKASDAWISLFHQIRRCCFDLSLVT